jgi:drug/metabolite transporter, DME family
VPGNRPEESATVSAADVARGRWLVVLAALLWSLGGVLLKSPPMIAIPADVRGPVIACYRALFAAAALVPFIDRRRVRLRWGLVPAVLVFATMNVLYVTAMSRTTAAAAIFLQYTATPWAFLVGLVFLGERIDRGNLVAVLAAVAGIGCIVWGDWNGANFAGNLIALASGFTLGLVLVSLRVLRNEDSGWLIALDHLVAGAVLLPWVWSLGVRLEGLQWALLAGMGMVQMGLPYFLFARASRTVPMQEAALLLLLEPVLNPLLVWLCWGETVGPAIWLGGSLIVGGLAVRFLVFRPTVPPATTRPTVQP